MLTEDATLVPSGAGTDPEARLAHAERLPRASTVGRYVILDVLGEGAMGVVYTAYDPRLERRVAIKLLHPSRRDAMGRLVREAQALARLSHPNVVSIHDVGDHGDQVFIAMELVRGRTVRAWLAERERSWSEVADVFRRAALGLAAAHAAGLVHRDFKPDNVMVTDDEPRRVLVMDFGLARDLEARPGPTSDEAPSASRADLTGTGGFAGTPAYMSPEQFEQRDIGPASDQFGFCVSLYEALFGERPFRGEDLAGLWADVRSRIPEPPRGRAVPPWLRDAVLRGLRRDAAERHPSMEALARALEGPSRSRVRIAVVALGVALVGGAVLVAASDDVDERRCERASQTIAAIWNDDRTETIRRAFEAREQGWGASTWDQAAATIDAFAEAWSATAYETCAATHVRGEQSHARLDARMDCLGVGRAHLAALLDTFEDPDSGVVERAGDAVRKLPDPRSCNETEPGVDTSPADREAATAARQAAATASALDDAGKFEAALRVADEALAEIGSAELPSARAALLRVRSETLRNLGRPAESEATIRDAVRSAVRGEDAVVEAQTWLDLVYTVGIEAARRSEALGHALAAELAVEKAGSTPALRVSLLSKLANIHVNGGDVDKALESIDAAHRLAVEHELDAWWMAEIYYTRGMVLDEMQRDAQAREAFEQALACDREVRGDTHPKTAMTISQIAIVCARQHDLECARGRYEEALSVLAASVGKTHHQYANTKYNYAVFLDDIGAHDEAEAGVREALEVWAGVHGARSEWAATGLLQLGITARKQGKRDLAVEHLRQALDLFAETAGRDDPRYAIVLSDLAHAELVRGRNAEALALLEESLRVREAKHGPNHPALAFALALQSEALRNLGRSSEAVAASTRAVQLREAGDVGPHLLGAAYLEAAHAHAAAGDVARARELAASARTQFAADEFGSEDVAVADALLAELRP